MINQIAYGLAMCAYILTGSRRAEEWTDRLANPQKPPRRDVLDFAQIQLTGINLLTIALCSTGEFIRFVRVVDAKKTPQRLDLPGILVGELEAMGFPTTLDGAVAYTAKQIETGVFAHLTLPAAAEAKVETPTVVPQAPSAGVNSQAVEKPPKAVKPSSTKPQKKGAAYTPPPTPAQKNRAGHIRQAEGEVVHVGPVRFTPPERPPYTVFCVKVKDHKSGAHVEFAGVELADLCEEQKIRLGDHARIELVGRVKTDVDDGQGNLVTRYKNQFAIKRI